MICICYSNQRRNLRHTFPGVRGIDQKFDDLSALMLYFTLYSDRMDV